MNSFLKMRKYAGTNTKNTNNKLYGLDDKELSPI